LSNGIKRPIDIVMEGMGFKPLGAKGLPQQYVDSYKAVEADIKINNICRTRVKYTYDVDIYMTQKVWDYHFDKVGFAKKIRDDYGTQCIYVSNSVFKEGVRIIRYRMSLLADVRR